MSNHFIRLEIPEGKVKELLDEMAKAQDIILKCYRELEDLGVVTIVPKGKAASGNRMDEQQGFSFHQEVFQHFGLDLLAAKSVCETEGKALDWGIVSTDKAEATTNNMLGFGMERSHRVIIDYDVNYNQVLVRREYDDPGKSSAP